MFKQSPKRVLKKMGFSADSNGIMKRYLRESENWHSHLENTKRFILKSAQSKTKGTVVVLGSGWHFDVPTEELILKFEKVYFIDIVHPPQLVHKYRRAKNVFFIETDITGLALPIYNLVRNYKKEKPDLLNLKPNCTNFGLPAEINIDFCVSVNMLNQLDILLLSYLKKFTLYNEAELLAFRKTIQEQHILAMPKGRSCLCTDFIEINKQEKSKKISEKQLVFAKFPIPKFTETWNWFFDKNGNYRQGMETIFKVKAIDF